MRTWVAGQLTVEANPPGEKPDARRYQAGHEQREREPAHGKGHRPSTLGCDQGDGEHGRIEERSPGEDLRDPEHEHGAPGPGDQIAKRKHDREMEGRCPATLAGSYPNPRDFVTGSPR